MQSEPSSAEVLQNFEWKTENFCEGGGTQRLPPAAKPATHPPEPGPAKRVLPPGPAKRDWLRSVNFFQQFPPILMTTHFPKWPPTQQDLIKIHPDRKELRPASQLCHAVSTPLFARPPGRQKSTHDKAGAPQPESPDLTNVYHEKGANS